MDCFGNAPIISPPLDRGTLVKGGDLQRVESKCLISLSRWGQRTTKVKRLSLLEGWHILKQEATLKFAGQIKALLTCY